jgi:hypothetical protein
MDVLMPFTLSAQPRVDASGCSYAWTRDGVPFGDAASVQDGVVIAERGAVVAFDARAFGCYGTAGGELSGFARVMALTVRRELREYPPAELARVMNAMHAMWTTSTAEGAARYGPNFVSIDDVDDLHRRNAGATDSGALVVRIGSIPRSGSHHLQCSYSRRFSQTIFTKA